MSRMSGSSASLEEFPCNIFPSSWRQDSQSVALLLQVPKRQRDAIKNGCEVWTIKQWRTRLTACVKGKGGHFEHNLYIPVQNDRLHDRFKFCKNLSGINDFTLIIIRKGVAEFGTRCI